MGAGDRLTGERLAAPAIVDGRAASAVRRQWRYGPLSDERAGIAIDALANLQILASNTVNCCREHGSCATTLL